MLLPLKDQEAGDEITEGSVNPHDILKIKGIDGVQRYILQEVQKVYRMQGIDINEKHIEIIVKQMINKIKVEDAGDTSLLPGGYAKILDFQDENKKAELDKIITIHARQHGMDRLPVMNIVLFLFIFFNLFVSNSGNNSNNGLSLANAFQTIQFAADLVAAGYTVFVENGTYEIVRAHV